MPRPRGVIAFAALFALAAFYLGVVGIARLISPATISLMAAKHFMYGLELAGPYMILLASSIYGVVACGLFRLKNWARWTAMLIIAFSITPLVPKISMAELGFPVLWYGLQIALRVAAGWYLAQSPSVLDAFAEARSSLPRSH